MGTAPLRQGLVKRVHDAKWVIATHVSGSETAMTNAYHASINHMLAHAAELHSMLEDSITSTADSQSPHWQFDTPELPGPYAPRWPMYVFLAGAIVCLSFSAVCHTLACVGARVRYGLVLYFPIQAHCLRTLRECTTAVTLTSTGN